MALASQKAYNGHNTRLGERLEHTFPNGDKILSENYFQHADHFTRILDEKEINNKSKISENLSSKSESEAISNESNKENEPERSQDIKGSN